MTCKNCETSLQATHLYCPECGAKVITHRLTLGYLLSEIYHAFLSIDSNKPVRTFIDLFKKPEEVIGGYIEGVRKRYIHAFGYFTVAVTISGFFYFVVLQFFPDLMEGVFRFQNTNEAQQQLNTSIQKTVFEYQSLLFFLAIPIFALLSWLVFLNKKKYNYAEHLIINLYAYSQVSIVSIILFCLTIWNEALFTILSISVIFIQIVYFAYVFKRLYNLTVWQVILKTLLFLVLLVPLYIISGIIMAVVLLLNGGLEELIEAEKMRQGVSYIASSSINWTSYKFL